MVAQPQATPELQAVFLKWWENLKEDNPPSSSETPRSSGITKDVYMWVLTRILSFLLTNTEESVTPAQGEREPWMNNDLARIRYGMDLPPCRVGPGEWCC